VRARLVRRRDPCAGACMSDLSRTGEDRSTLPQPGPVRSGPASRRGPPHRGQSSAPARTRRVRLAIDRSIDLPGLGSPSPTAAARGDFRVDPAPALARWFVRCSAPGCWAELTRTPAAMGPPPVRSQPGQRRRSALLTPSFSSRQGAAGDITVLDGPRCRPAGRPHHRHMVID
jgi:hypothetical protein